MLIFVIRDDAQGCGHHVEAHRSIALIAEQYVKQMRWSSLRTTVNVIQTIEEVLGLDPATFNRVLWQGLQRGLGLTENQVPLAFEEAPLRWPSAFKDASLGSIHDCEWLHGCKRRLAVRLPLRIACNTPLPWYFALNVHNRKCKCLKNIHLTIGNSAALELKLHAQAASARGADGRDEEWR